ncbi:hypothetical protein [Jatrophihabitans fulvus]
MTPRRARPADVIAAVHTLPDGLRFVAVDGFGAAGKTTLADAVAAAHARACVVHLDDLQGVGITEWDWNRLRREIVTPLLAGAPARYAVWSWGEAAPRGSAVVPAGAIVVIEGVSATRREADVPWDLTVWVEASEPVRRRRARERDGADAEAVWRDHWVPSELAWAARERPWERVDLVVSGEAGEPGTMESL